MVATTIEVPIPEPMRMPNLGSEPHLQRLTPDRRPHAIHARWAT
jgi:hypothetical protein